MSASAPGRAVLAPRLRIVVVGSARDEASWVAEVLAESRTRIFDTSTRSRETLAEAPIRSDSADVLMLSMGGADSGDVVREFVEVHGPMPVVVVGDRTDEDFAFEMLGAGACAYLARADVTSRLLRARQIAA